MASKAKKSPDKPEESTKSELMKKFKANPFVFVGTFVVLIIVIIAFVFLPAIVPRQGGGIDLNFGSYNKIPVIYADGNYFYQIQQSLARQNQSNMDESNYTITLYRIWREAFESAVVNIAILDEMKRAGYSIPDEVVDRAVAQLPDFQENGRFSTARYRQMDNYRRMTLWRQVRDSIIADYYVSDVSYLKSPSREGAFISSMSSPQRSFDMVSFPISSYPDSEITAYVTANPEMFRITHLSKITVTSNEREARQILASIQNGTETFEDAARNKSRDYYADNAGDMGSRMVYELLSEIPNAQDREAVIGLARGALSSAIKIGDNAWAIFRAEEPVRNADTNDAVVMEKVRGYMLSYERGRAEDWTIGEAEKFIASVNTSGFDSAAADRVMAKQTFGPLPLNYGDAILFPSVQSSGISELYYAGFNDRFWQVCFSTPIGTPSVPVVVNSNVLVILPLEETEADEDEAGFIEMYYSYFLAQSFEQDIRTHFLNNGKLDDRFWDVFQYFITD